MENVRNNSVLGVYSDFLMHQSRSLSSLYCNSLKKKKNIIKWTLLSSQLEIIVNAVERHHAAFIHLINNKMYLFMFLVCLLLLCFSYCLETFCCFLGVFIKLSLVNKRTEQYLFLRKDLVVFSCFNFLKKLSDAIFCVSAFRQRLQFLIIP